jgi:hypothetical protein
MAKRPDSLPDGFDADEPGGWLAEENDLDRRALWRLGAWGVGSVAAVIVAVMASQSSIGLRRDQIAAADLTRQSQQIASVAKETQSEARRLASAIDTLNGDRDRLYSRVTVLEQNLDSVTGSIARQSSTLGWPPAGIALPAATETQSAVPALPPPGGPPATVAALTDKSREAARRQPEATPATPLMPAKSMMAPPDPAAQKLVVPEQPPEIITAAPEAAASPTPDQASAKPSAETPVQRTEFGVDLGGASSVDGLRALWRGLLTSNGEILAALRPIIVLKERSNGPGMQLRLVAGPLIDAAAAARICAALMENRQACETSVFDGQRLAMKSDDAPAVVRPTPRKRTAVKRAMTEEPVSRPKPSTLSPAFGRTVNQTQDQSDRPTSSTR